MERILKNERRVEGDCKRYLLRYTLVSNGFPKEEGEGIYFEKMVQGEVMPVSLNEIVDDWKSAFYMGRKESA